MTPDRIFLLLYNHYPGCKVSKAGGYAPHLSSAFFEMLPALRQHLDYYVGLFFQEEYGLPQAHIISQ